MSHSPEAGEGVLLGLHALGLSKAGPRQNFRGERKSENAKLRSLGEIGLSDVESEACSGSNLH